MVSRRQGHLAHATGGLQMPGIIFQKWADPYAALRLKITGRGKAIPARGGLNAGGKQMPIRGLTKVQQEIHVKAGSHRLGRIAPFGNQYRFWPLLLQPAPQLRSQPTNPGTIRIILDQGIRHIHPETIATSAQPKIHDRAQLCPGGSRSRRI